MRDSEQIDLAHASAFRLATLVIEPGLRQVVDADGGSETLEPRVMQVLVALAMANGAIVSRDDLVRRCWEGRIVGDDSINRVIGRLRRLAEEKGQGAFHIETITKVGYRLIGRVELIASPQPPPLQTWSPATPLPQPVAPADPPPPTVMPIPPAPARAAPPPQPSPPPPSPSPSGRINRRVLVGGGAVAALAAAGAVAWRTRLVGGPVRTAFTPHLTPPSGRAPFSLETAADGALLAFDGRDGKLLRFDAEGEWTLAGSTPEDTVDVAPGPGGEVYVTTQDGRVLSLPPGDGKPPTWEARCDCDLGGRIAAMHFS